MACARCDFNAVSCRCCRGRRRHHRRLQAWASLSLVAARHVRVLVTMTTTTMRTMSDGRVENDAVMIVYGYVHTHTLRLCGVQRRQRRQSAAMRETLVVTCAWEIARPQTHTHTSFRFCTRYFSISEWVVCLVYVCVNRNRTWHSANKPLLLLAADRVPTVPDASQRMPQTNVLVVDVRLT